MTLAFGALTDLILLALDEHGTLSAQELAQHTGGNYQNVRSVISRLRKPGRRTPKRLYITAWVYDEGEQRRYPRAVYAAGDQPCKKRPRSTQREKTTRRVARDRVRRITDALTFRGST